ncbi:GDYXXLXY domain-containing protein [Hymenobacter fastidiosus]|uniref:GDYXXLXY domain-containing protein n=1 Tax=Hymenobacter fastidiosus TaxID=486264 RepID=A0ABP7RWG2_9BACT
MATPLPLARRHRLVLLAVAAQVLFLLSVAAAGYATTAWGRTITLRTAPVDPRDLLYGDYVRLNYTISQVPIRLWREAGRAARTNEPVYVVLQPARGAYEATAVFAREPAVEPRQIVLRGWVTNSWRQGLRIRYGLERYYVPEGEGRKLERQAALLVHVSIAPWGQARITEVVSAPK